MLLRRCLSYKGLRAQMYSMNRLIMEKRFIDCRRWCGLYISDGVYLVDLLETSGAKRPKGRSNQVSCR
jgi:hypothetical protein